MLITLSAVASRATHLDVACTRCDRRGRYAVASLAARYATVRAALDGLTADCPRRSETRAYELCGAHCPGLAGVMGMVG